MELKEGTVVKTLKDKTFILDRGKKITIPKGFEGFISKIDGDSLFLEIKRVSAKTLILFDYKTNEVELKRVSIDIDFNL